MSFNLQSFSVNLVNFDVGIGALTRGQKKKKYDNVLSLIRAAVCLHQGLIAECHALGNDYHKKLRTATEAADRDRVRAAYDSLHRLHARFLKKSWDDSTKIVEQYFASTHRSETLPRFCIKVVKRVASEGGVIVNNTADVIRQDGTRTSLISPISGNTGFSSCESSGRFYLENNIPEAVKSRGYINPRLNLALARAYKSPNKFTPKFGRKSDIDWIKCWAKVGDDKLPDELSCYKSTLIVPMTLINNVIVGDGPLGVSPLADEKDGRLIYGFLCFDHKEVNYFSESDVNFGYMLADLFSLYLIFQKLMFENSAIVGQAKSYID